MIDEKSSTTEDVKDGVTEETVNDNGTSTNKDEKAEKGLRAELINERKQRQELQKKLRDIEEKDALQKGEHEKLMNQYKSEADTLKAQLEKSDLELAKWREYEDKQRQGLKDILGDIPNFDIMPYETLEALAKKIKNKPPDTSSDRPDTKKEFKLTEAQKRDAYDKFPRRSKEDAEKSYYKIFVEPKINKGK